jgi:3-oxocholest-4-en-26-oyl-CoA dehydrogenase alpha subunit
MDFKFSKEEIEFRDEVKEWIEKAVPKRWYELNTGYWQETPETWQITRDFHKKLGAKGWLAPAYPKKYGGAELGHIKRLILAEELANYSAPLSVETEITVNWVGMALQHFGTEEQKSEYVTRIARGDIIFAVGYSEPNSGSDLGSIQTKAEQKGDEFIINGQKIWCSYGHLADYCYLATVTDSSAPKHKNMSLIIVDMKSPGVKIVPIINVIGHHSFNEVFLDDVKVPSKNLVGVKGNGWFQLATALDFERSGIQNAAVNKVLLNKIIEFARTHKRNGKLISNNPVLKNEIAELAIEVEIARMACYRIAWLYSVGRHSSYESSMGMIFMSELLRRVSEFGTRLMGQYGQLMSDSKYAWDRAEIVRSFLSSISIGVGGGTNEIQRNIIATRGLGLPREK